MRRRDPILPCLLLSLALAVPACLLAAAAGTSAPAKAQKSSPDKVRRAAAEDNNPYLKRFKELDRNQDGYVTLDEWPLEPAKFAIVDRNKDGRLSRGELLRPNIMPMDRRDWQLQPLDTSRGRTRLQDSQASNPEDLWSSRATLPDLRRFRDLDRNHDNRLSRPEWTGAPSLFNRLDRNQDGVLSPNEWEPRQPPP
jgi:hypothetical protein